MCISVQQASVFVVRASAFHKFAVPYVQEFQCCANSYNVFDGRHEIIGSNGIIHE